MGWASKLESELEKQFSSIEHAVLRIETKLGVDLTSDLVARIRRATDETQAFAVFYLQQLPIDVREYEDKVHWLKFENEINDDELKSEILSLRRQIENFRTAAADLRRENDALRKQRDILKSQFVPQGKRLPAEYKALDTYLRNLMQNEKAL